MMKNRSVLVLFTALSLGGYAHAEMTLRSEAAYVSYTAEGHQGHGHRSAPEIHLRNGQGSAARLWTPDLDTRDLALDAPDRIVVRPTGTNSYHALVVTREDRGVTEAAMRYLYFNGKPADKTPSDLVARQKVDLEIAPDPLPREHWRYLSGEPARFVVRYQGKPLRRQPVSLYTCNGTLIQGRTDEDGRWEVELPDDFVEIRPGRRNNRPGDFVVRTRLESGGREYRTTLSAAYSVNPSHWQSSGFGALALAGGFITGLVVMRRAGRGGSA